MTNLSYVFIAALLRKIKEGSCCVFMIVLENNWETFFLSRISLIAEIVAWQFWAQRRYSHMFLCIRRQLHKPKTSHSFSSNLFQSFSHCCVLQLAAHVPQCCGGACMESGPGPSGIDVLRSLQLELQSLRWSVRNLEGRVTALEEAVSSQEQLPTQVLDFRFTLSRYEAETVEGLAEVHSRVDRLLFRVSEAEGQVALCRFVLARTLNQAECTDAPAFSLQAVD